MAIPAKIKKKLEKLDRMKTKKCKICGTEFVKKVWHQATCSYECQKENRKIVSKRFAEKRRNTFITKQCKYCKKDFETNTLTIRTYCSKLCQSKQYSESRKGKNNPAYRTGDYAKKTGKLRKGKQGKHLWACKKYRKHFLSQHDYAFCEVCGCNETATPRFEVHHIYYASRYPNHPELHNFKNLVHICIECHNKFHKEEYKEEFVRLEKERGLKKLFSV